VDLNLDVRVISGTRTYAEQNALYAHGRTAPGPIVTNARGGYSFHNFGIAFDIGIFQGRNYVERGPGYTAAGHLGERIGLEWGGSWRTFQDMPHFQYPGVTLSGLRSRFEQGLSPIPGYWTVKTQAISLSLAAVLLLCGSAEGLAQELRFPDVRTTVDNIDAHPSALKKSKATLETGTDRGGELTIYRTGRMIVRIDASIGLSNSDLKDVFYYSNGKIIFIRSQRVTYPYSSVSSQFDFTKARIESKVDYYVTKRKLIPVASQAKTASSVASGLLRLGEYLFNAVRRGDQTIDVEKLLK
jgi:D-alanyl-D-alanine carboxypeptidase